jgi:hypothetical protein
VTTSLRRKLALAAGLALLAVPALSACTTATDRPNVLANGGYDLSGNMRVLAARIVASNDNQGVFVATIALDPSVDAAGTSPSDQPSLTGLAAGPVAPAQSADEGIDPATFSPVEVGASGMVNLADPSVGGIPVTGVFKAGDVLPVSLTFSDGETLTVQTPVVAQCDDYASVVPQGASTPATPSTEGAYSCSYPSLPPVTE